MVGDDKDKKVKSFFCRFLPRISLEFVGQRFAGLKRCWSVCRVVTRGKKHSGVVPAWSRPSKIERRACEGKGIFC